MSFFRKQTYFSKSNLKLIFIMNSICNQILVHYQNRKRSLRNRDHKFLKSKKYFKFSKNLTFCLNFNLKSIIICKWCFILIWFYFRSRSNNNNSRHFRCLKSDTCSSTRRVEADTDVLKWKRRAIWPTISSRCRCERQQQRRHQRRRQAMSKWCRTERTSRAWTRLSLAAVARVARDHRRA